MEDREWSVSCRIGRPPFVHSTFLTWWSRELHIAPEVKPGFQPDCIPVRFSFMVAIGRMLFSKRRELRPLVFYRGPLSGQLWTWIQNAMGFCGGGCSRIFLNSSCEFFWASAPNSNLYRCFTAASAIGRKVYCFEE